MLATVRGFGVGTLEIVLTGKRGEPFPECAFSNISRRLELAEVTHLTITRYIHPSGEASAAVDWEYHYCVAPNFLPHRRSS